jgi:hypothetical protein
MNNSSVDNYLYIFLDEGGNFDFSVKGTKYFTISSVCIITPWIYDEPLSLLKYQLLANGLDIEYFHASEDKQQIRNKVFKVITQKAGSFLVDSIIVEKSKTNPSLYEKKKFYPKILGYLIRHVIEVEDVSKYKGFVIVTDSIPVKKQKQAVEKAIKTTIVSMMKSTSKPYLVVHHSSKSSFCLQIADYCNWAIYRKWSGDDSRSYDLIKDCIRSEFDIFKNGKICYY